MRRNTRQPFRELALAQSVWRGVAVILLTGVLAVCGLTQKMNFFVTSVPAGDGGNLGGLAGADAHCQKLAAAAGSRRTRWRAYRYGSRRDARHCQRT